MTIVCIRAFGTSQPGDEIPGIPDSAIFDTYYFAVKPEVEPPEATAIKAKAKSPKEDDD